VGSGRAGRRRRAVPGLRSPQQHVLHGRRVPLRSALCRRHSVVVQILSDLPRASRRDFAVAGSA